MKLWVYIYKDEIGDMKIALSSSIGNIISIRQLNLSIIYLRPFDIAFDALAHKLLLETLSKESVLMWIDKHKKETEMWMRVSGKDE